MATDTTALAEAIAAMRATVTAADAAIMYDKVPSTIHAEARIFGAFRNEIEAGRALLAALDGVPERIAALETLYAHAWNFNGMHDDFTAALDALAALDASRKGAGCGTD